LSSSCDLTPGVVGSLLAAFSDMIFVCYPFSLFSWAFEDSDMYVLIVFTIFFVNIKFSASDKKQEMSNIK
jgi:hypothetical protein